MDNSSTQLLFDNDQLWVLLIGSIVPLGGYLINKVMPWKKETVKAITQVVLTSIAANIGGFVPFLQQAFSATVAGLFAHNILWKPSNVNIKFGAIPTPTQGASLSADQVAGLSSEQQAGLVLAAPPAVPAAAQPLAGPAN